MNPTAPPAAAHPYPLFPRAAPQAQPVVRVRHTDLVDFVTAVFTARGLAPGRAREAARALCYGDLTGMTSHGLTNLTRLYLPLFDRGRVDPLAEPCVLADRGASVLLDARQALGLWAAGLAVDLAADRAATYGVGMVSVR
ncbi:MAG: Ldh family oxidoreductase, partial [Nonomuraea sp.]|nr:Ldh family oxidoreductase [Nonomuraea sp.]